MLGESVKCGIACFKKQFLSLHRNPKIMLIDAIIVTDPMGLVTISVLLNGFYGLEDIVKFKDFDKLCLLNWIV